jgi:SpoVK/Ycf46/Vps4 family AAA+-type ATPase
MSFADLAGVLRDAALEALRADRAAQQVKGEHLERAIARWRAGRSKSGR